MQTTEIIIPQIRIERRESATAYYWHARFYILGYGEAEHVVSASVPKKVNSTDPEFELKPTSYSATAESFREINACLLAAQAWIRERQNERFASAEPQP